MATEGTIIVCPNCGTYNGIDVLHLDAKAKQKPE